MPPGPASGWNPVPLGAGADLRGQDELVAPPGDGLADQPLRDALRRRPRRCRPRSSRRRRPAWMPHRSTSVFGRLAPHASPPASHAPKPITESSGPVAPSRRVRMPAIQTQRGFPSASSVAQYASMPDAQRVRTDEERHRLAGHRDEQDRRGTRARRHPVRRRLRRRDAADRRPVHQRHCARSATISPPCRTSRPRSGRRPARSTGSRPSRSSSRRTRRHHPRRPRRRPGGHEPGGAEGRPGRRWRAAAPSSSTRTRSPQRNLEKAGYAADPPTDGTLDGYQVYPRADDLDHRSGRREPSASARKRPSGPKNMFALGLVSWMYGRPTEPRSSGSRRSSAASRRSTTPTSRRSTPATTSARRPSSSRTRSTSRPRPAEPGTYRNVAGAQALAWGLIAASQSERAAAVLRELPDHAGLRPAARAVQAQELRRRHRPGRGRDRRGQHGARARRSPVTSRSPARAGPGLDLKAETIGLAVITELPMIVVDVQRAGPSTGMPTKTEQGDLLHAMFGRHGESPIPIVAASSPADCFEVAMEAARVAIRYRTPVILLSDSFLQNSSEPWLLPDVDALPTIDPHFAEAERRGRSSRTRATTRLARPVGDPGHARPRAPDRRARARGRHGRHQLRARRTTSG